MTHLVAKGLASSTVDSTGGVPSAASNNLPVQIVNLDESVVGTTDFNDTQFPNAAFLRVNVGAFNKTGSEGMSALVNSTSLTPILIGSGTVTGGNQTYNGTINAATVSDLGGLAGVTGTRTQTNSGQGATDFDATASHGSEVGGVEWVRTLESSRTSYTNADGSTYSGLSVVASGSFFGQQPLQGGGNASPPVVTTWDVPANAAVITISSTSSRPGPQDDTTFGGTYTVVGTGYNSNTVANGQTRHLRGPAYQSGDQSNLSFHGTVGVGTLTVTTNGLNHQSANTQNSISAGTRTAITVNEYDYTLRNDRTDGLSVVLNGDTRGGTRTLAPGDSSPVIVDNTETDNETARIAGTFSLPSQAQFTSGTTRGVSASAINERTIQRNQPNTTVSGAHNSWSNYTGNQTTFSATGVNNANSGGVFTSGTITFENQVTVSNSTTSIFGGSSVAQNNSLIGDTEVTFGGQTIYGSGSNVALGPNGSHTVATAGHYIVSGGIGTGNPDSDSGSATVFTINGVAYSGSIQNGGAGASFAGTLNVGDVIAASGSYPSVTVNVIPSIGTGAGVGSIVLAAGTHTLNFRQTGGNNNRPGLSFNLSFAGGGRVTYAGFTGGTTGQTAVATTVWDIRATNSNAYNITTNAASTGDPVQIPANGNVNLVTAVEAETWTVGWDTQRPAGTALNAYSLTNNSDKRIFVGGVEVADGDTVSIASGESSTTRDVSFTQRQDALSGDWNTDDFTGTIIND